MLLILQVNTKQSTGSERVEVPTCFRMYKDVTDKPEYSNFVMARKDYEMFKGDKEETQVSD